MADTKKVLRAAVAMPLVVPADIEENIRRMEPMVSEAARRGADVVVFSETGVTGYDVRGASVAKRMKLDDPRFDWIANLAKQHKIVVIAGFHEAVDEHRYNSATVFYPDGTRVTQRKHFIMEPEWKHSAIEGYERKRHIFEVNGFKLAILICSDSGTAGIHEELAAAGVDAVVAPTAGLGDIKHAFRQREFSDPKRFEAYLNAAESVCFMRGGVERAVKLNLGLIACNQAGFSEAMGYFQCGHAAVIDRTGEITALIPGRFCADHLRPELAIGLISAKA